MTSAGDDSARVKGYEEMGVTVVKGDGRLAGPGRLTVDGSGDVEPRAVLAIRAEVPLEVLLETVAQFPSYSEAYLSALQQLEL